VIVGSKLMQIVGEGGPDAAADWLRGVRQALDAAAGSGVGGTGG
jgi:hypothetical protein